MEWLAYKPDLNLIKHFWAILKRRLRKQTVIEKYSDENFYEFGTKLTQMSYETCIRTIQPVCYILKKLKV